MSKRYAVKQRRGHLFRIMRHVKHDEAERLIELGKVEVRAEASGEIWLELMRDGAGEAVATEAAKLGMRVASAHAEPVARASCTVLSRVEAEAATGLRGRSRTAGLSEAQRLARMSEGRQVEDFVERSMAKLEGFRPGTLATA